jgi:hypothetical protein
MFACAARPTEEDQIAGCEGMYFKYAQGLVARLKENPTGPGWMQHHDPDVERVTRIADRSISR